MAAPLPSKPRSHITGAHTGPIQALSFNKQGEYIISGGQDRLIKLWNTSTTACIQEYEGHGWEVLDVAM
jgi:mitogen-activated protein kinase organizer 1